MGEQLAITDLLSGFRGIKVVDFHVLLLICFVEDNNRDVFIADMNIGTPADSSSYPTPSVANSTSPIFCARDETSECTMDYVDPSINEEVADIENTDMIATDDEVQKSKRAKTFQVWNHFEESKNQDGLKQLFCKHRKNVFKKPSSGATSHLGRHLKSCPIKLGADALEERDS
ncbi:hypothetical protein BUALT_Bualt11G0015400 [Buddleja alternifolia]|uniref:BED-type domain-containing protein n=1 Tax=Buddleja alternifolia TaxID=168488 RepID=A0AAV6WT27_9LAMI|nr:hypothetical protein BUALT_Bualt11G0015400 [Buddleja alternifolia]